MLAALAAHAREGGVVRARIDDDGHALRWSAHPQVGVVHAHALEQRRLLPTHTTHTDIGVATERAGQGCGFSLTCSCSPQTAFSVEPCEYLEPHRGSGAAAESAASRWERETTTTRRRRCPGRVGYRCGCGGLYLGRGRALRRRPGRNFL